MKKLVKSAFLCLTLVSVFFAFACKHGEGEGGGVDKPSFERIKLGDVEGVKITPPSEGIVGADAPVDMPEYNTSDGGSCKGVFIKDRTVKLSTYAIGKTEVTYELWKKVYDWAVKQENGYKFANKGLEGFINEGGGGSHPNYTDIGKPATENSQHPVTMVSWRDCIVWCNAYTEKVLGKDHCVYRDKNDHNAVLKDATNVSLVDSAYADMDKKGFRLPTEAEWEYAARLNSDRKTLIPVNYASGATANWKDDNATNAVAWHKGNSEAKTSSVGQKAENAIGLYDMSGNVWEWCFDRYNKVCTTDDENYKKDEMVTNPQGALSGDERSGRGGSWYDDSKYSIVGSRTKGASQQAHNFLGFRLVWKP